MTARSFALVRAVLLAIGLGIIAALVWQIGPGLLLQSLGAIGAGSLLVLPPYLLVFVLNALAWQQAFTRDIPLGVGRLTAFQIIGKAINLATPLLPLGGEPVKAHLLGRLQVPFPEALASVVVSRTLVTVAQGLVIVAAIGLALATLDVPTPLLRQAQVGVLIGAVLVGLFVLTQTRGLFGRLAALLGRARLGPASLGPGAQEVDRLIATYYRHHLARRGTQAVVLHVLAFAAEGLEVYIVLSLLGVPASPGLALTVMGLSAAVRAAAFAMPAGLGIQEAGNVVIFVSLGLSPEVAMVFSVLRRFREAAWALAGFILLGRLSIHWRDLRLLASGGARC